MHMFGLHTSMRLSHPHEFKPTPMQNSNRLISPSSPLLCANLRSPYPTGTARAIPSGISGMHHEYARATPSCYRGPPDCVRLLEQVPCSTGPRRIPSHSDRELSIAVSETVVENHTHARLLLLKDPHFGRCQSFGELACRQGFPCSSLIAV